METLFRKVHGIRWFDIRHVRRVLVEVYCTSTGTCRLCYVEFQYSSASCANMGVIENAAMSIDPPIYDSVRR